MNKTDVYISKLGGIKNKTVIVTGANSGLGYYISRVALLKGARLIMACRNESRANEAKEKLIKETGSTNVEVVLYDQSDFSSVIKFADLIKTKYKGFYALVLNAGIFMPKDKYDELHISLVYKTNFLGSLFLLDCLKDLISNSEEERRIILQGSLATFIYKYKNKDKLIFANYPDIKQYSLSKLCVSNIYAYYRNNNKNPNVKYLLAEPGVATTNLFSGFKKWFKKIALLYMKIFANDSKTGALSACKLMCDKVANGDYYHPSSPFTFKGLPKKDVFKDKYIYENIISDGREIIKEYE